MSNIVKIIIGVIVAGFAGFGVWAYVVENSSNIDYEQYDLNVIHEGDAASGGISDHVKGNADAKVLIFEYADYQCSGCATVSPWLEELIEEYDGEVAIVYRSFLLSYHTNAKAAASAVEAAGLQGYWQEYGNYLFENQADWYYATVNTRTDLFASYFEEVTGGEGDVKQFRKDLASTEVAKKVSFDVNLAKRVNIEATPTLVINGEVLDWYDNNTKAGFLEFMRKAIAAAQE